MTTAYFTRNPSKKIETICGIYLQAAELAECGTQVYSTDEMTGIQALERKYPDKPVRPGIPALHEFEYIRQSIIILQFSFLCRSHGSTGRSVVGHRDITVIQKYFQVFLMVETVAEPFWILFFGTLEIFSRTHVK